MEAPIDVKDGENVQDVETLTGDITCKNLTFRYPGGGYDVLEDVSFHISAGENVGIIGKTGAGKTTLVDLLLRLQKRLSGQAGLSDRRNAAYLPGI